MCVNLPEYEVRTPMNDSYRIIYHCIYRILATMVLRWLKEEVLWYFRKLIGSHFGYTPCYYEPDCYNFVHVNGYHSPECRNCFFEH